MLQLPQEAPTSLDLHAAMAALLSRTSALRPLLRRAMHRRAFAAPATTVRSEAPLSTTFPAKIEERRVVSVLGLPLAAVDVLLAKGGALFDGLDDGVAKARGWLLGLLLLPTPLGLLPANAFWRGRGIRILHGRVEIARFLQNALLCLSSRRALAREE